MALRVLFIEDSSEDVSLLVQELKHGGYDVVFKQVETKEEMEAALNNNEWDIIIADYSMPHFSAEDAVALLIRREDIELPFIVVSGLIGEDIAVEMIKKGAHDYIMKDKLSRLCVAVEREIKAADLRKERRRMEEALRKREEELAIERATVEIEKQKTAEIEVAYQQLRKTQDMLIQSEKLSAVGLLSAGIAHELNNPLTGILGIARYYANLKGHEGREHDDLKQIVYAGERMAVIIKGLLKFSAPSTSGIEVLNCNDVIEMVLDFSQRIMHDKNVLVQKSLMPGLPMVKADNNRIQQVIFNIIGNAFDAIEKDGVLKIFTRDISINGCLFVEMEFMDNGSGIKKEDLGKIFDPFFTTKKPGKGTGLGLAVSYSIVKQYKGEILVESPVTGQEAGTSFKVRLPAIAASGCTENS